MMSYKKKQQQLLFNKLYPSHLEESFHYQDVKLGGSEIEAMADGADPKCAVFWTPVGG